jgi:quinol monooxygenase YgiN
MIVVVFKAKCRPEKTEQALTLFRDIVTASRRLKGVVSFDIGRDIADPNSFIATEVYEERSVLGRQEALPPTKKVIGLLDQLLVSPPEMTIYEATPAEA